ncbi:hypothetical protein CIB95_12555 [Lottiidibacillus patelloidae]|uniref:Uncharacterized protein n=1 Tax=Lottiidibacillus patelloidae TaxID=2670334 RepID=A0A263BRP8_9BACI|nr:hypothetical protein [Lottiidibacillus patelloidae]OZM56248.1 hypothetical protein CIB95_12555 [Lottiidibacillus patelloidae]
MIGYAFLASEEKFLQLISSIQNHDTFWLRNSLETKEIGFYNKMHQLTEFDRDGRLFTESWELRYQRNGDYFNCLLVSEQEMEENLEGIEFNNQNLEELNPRAKAYIVESLGAIVKSETVFKDEVAKILIKEYKFNDEYGGLGYRLCGVL